MTNPCNACPLLPECPGADDYQYRANVEFYKACRDLVDAIQQAVEPVVDAIIKTCQELNQALSGYAQNASQALAEIYGLVAEYNSALSWAATHRPKWLHIYKQTKKKRTRKKYYDRIMRAYAEEGKP